LKDGVEIDSDMFQKDKSHIYQIKKLIIIWCISETLLSVLFVISVMHKVVGDVFNIILNKLYANEFICYTLTNKFNYKTFINTFYEKAADEYENDIDNMCKYNCLNFIKYVKNNRPDIIITASAVNNAAMYGHKDLFYYLQKNGHYCTNEAMEGAIKNNDLKMVKYLTANQSCLNKFTTTIIEYGRVHMLKYFHNIGVKNHVSDDCFTAARNGKLNIIKYHESKKAICKSLMRRLLNMAIMYNHLNIVKHLYLVCKCVNKYEANYAASKGYFGVVKFLCDNGFKFSNVKTIETVMIGNIRLIKLLHKNGVKFGTHSMCVAIDKGYFSIVKFLHENGVKISKNAMRQAIRGNNLHIVKFLFKLDPIKYKIDIEYMRTAAYRQNLSIIKYIYNNAFNKTKKYVIPRHMVPTTNLDIIKYVHKIKCLSINYWAICNTIRNCDVEILDFIYNNYSYLFNSDTYLREYVSQTVKYNKLEILKYIIDIYRKKHTNILLGGMMKRAALNGNIEIMKYLKSIGKKYSTKSLLCLLKKYTENNRKNKIANINKNLFDMIKIMCESGVKVNRPIMIECLIFGDHHIVEYVHNMGVNFNKNDMKYATNANNIKLLKYLASNNISYDRLSLFNAKFTNNVQALTYFNSLDGAKFVKHFKRPRIVHGKYFPNSEHSLLYFKSLINECDEKIEKHIIFYNNFITNYSSCNLNYFDKVSQSYDILL